MKRSPRKNEDVIDYEADEELDKLNEIPPIINSRKTPGSRWSFVSSDDGGSEYMEDDGVYIEGTERRTHQEITHQNLRSSFETLYDPNAMKNLENLDNPPKVKPSYHRTVSLNSIQPKSQSWNASKPLSDEVYFSESRPQNQMAALKAKPTEKINFSSSIPQSAQNYKWKDDAELEFSDAASTLSPTEDPTFNIDDLGDSKEFFLGTLNEVRAGSRRSPNSLSKPMEYDTVTPQNQRLHSQGYPHDNKDRLNLRLSNQTDIRPATMPQTQKSLLFIQDDPFDDKNSETSSICSEDRILHIKPRNTVVMKWDPLIQPDKDHHNSDVNKRNISVKNERPQSEIFHQQFEPTVPAEKEISRDDSGITPMMKFMQEAGDISYRNFIKPNPNPQIKSPELVIQNRHQFESVKSINSRPHNLQNPKGDDFNPHKPQRKQRFKSHGQSVTSPNLDTDVDTISPNYAFNQFSFEKEEDPVTPTNKSEHLGSLTHQHPSLTPNKFVNPNDPRYKISPPVPAVVRDPQFANFRSNRTETHYAKRQEPQPTPVYQYQTRDLRPNNFVPAPANLPQATDHRKGIITTVPPPKSPNEIKTSNPPNNHPINRHTGNQRSSDPKVQPGRINVSSGLVSSPNLAQETNFPISQPNGDTQFCTSSLTTRTTSCQLNDSLKPIGHISGGSLMQQKPGAGNSIKNASSINSAFDRYQNSNRNQANFAHPIAGQFASGQSNVYPGDYERMNIEPATHYAPGKSHERYPRYNNNNQEVLRTQSIPSIYNSQKESYHQHSPQSFNSDSGDMFSLHNPPNMASMENQGHPNKMKPVNSNPNLSRAAQKYDQYISYSKRVPQTQDQSNRRLNNDEHLRQLQVDTSHFKTQGGQKIPSARPGDKVQSKPAPSVQPLGQYRAMPVNQDERRFHNMSTSRWVSNWEPISPDDSVRAPDQSIRGHAIHPHNQCIPPAPLEFTYHSPLNSRVKRPSLPGSHCNSQLDSFTVDDLGDDWVKYPYRERKTFIKHDDAYQSDAIGEMEKMMDSLNNDEDLIDRAAQREYEDQMERFSGLPGRFEVQPTGSGHLTINLTDVDPDINNRPITPISMGNYSTRSSNDFSFDTRSVGSTQRSTRPHKYRDDFSQRRLRSKERVPDYTNPSNDSRFDNESSFQSLTSLNSRRSSDRGHQSRHSKRNSHEEDSTPTQSETNSPTRFFSSNGMNQSRSGGPMPLRQLKQHHQRHDNRSAESSSSDIPESLEEYNSVYHSSINTNQNLIPHSKQSHPIQRPLSFVKDSPLPPSNLLESRMFSNSLEFARYYFSSDSPPPHMGELFSPPIQDRPNKKEQCKFHGSAKNLHSVKREVERTTAKPPSHQPRAMKTKPAFPAGKQFRDSIPSPSKWHRSSSLIIVPPPRNDDLLCHHTNRMVQSGAAGGDGDLLWNKCASTEDVYIETKTPCSFTVSATNDNIWITKAPSQDQMKVGPQCSQSRSSAAGEVIAIPLPQDPNGKSCPMSVTLKFGSDTCLVKKPDLPSLENREITSTNGIEMKPAFSYRSIFNIDISNY